MEPAWPQDTPTWAPRELNMAQESVKIGTSWSQHGHKMPRMWQYGLTHAPILENIHFPSVFEDFRRPEGSLRWPKREPKSGQDGQVGTKMAQESAKIGPRWPSWSQHGSKMAKDEPAWANIGTQHGLRLRITTPVQKIRASKGGGSSSHGKPSRRALGRIFIDKE